MKNRGDDGEIKSQKIIDGMTVRTQKSIYVALFNSEYVNHTTNNQMH